MGGAVGVGKLSTIGGGHLVSTASVPDRGYEGVVGIVGDAFAKAVVIADPPDGGGSRSNGGKQQGSEE